MDHASGTLEARQRIVILIVAFLIDAMSWFSESLAVKVTVAPLTERL